MTALTPSTEWPQSLTILDIADIIRREGNGLYSDGGLEGCVYQASLCGLTAAYARGGNVIMLASHDLRVAIRVSEKPVDESDGVVFNSDSRMDVTADYIKGSPAVLDAWHRHLCAYRRSMRPALDKATAA